ncbi:hypothetical protein B9P84_22170 [Citrobacter braakii]|uniref:hypothetical protein n=1 Tax=Citrobacter freundii complex TaxID=1344959 RepID=UPI000B9AF408|nr:MULTISPECIES: hypothetical protein [Citrobacter freundii complex]EKZ3398142.1 hypothetical protein [Citrobacter freundii]EKZ3406591.1 hypothetical protein [Citrobacter freundii]MBJ8674494.1 hypothetical protein [Citrobacter freundii]MDL4385316.1 hypothetical protein [Citrobacter braakii]OXU09666.1 hypothetical protein B9P84_22170 [Citrobacter braakii]
MNVEQIAARLNTGPATLGELVRAGASAVVIADMVRAGVAVVLQFHEDSDVMIIGGYGTPAPQ